MGGARIPRILRRPRAHWRSCDIRIGFPLATDALMRIKIAAMVLGLVIAGAPALATIARARDPAPPSAPPAAQAAVVKKPATKQTRAVPHGREDVDPLAEVPSFSAEAVGWQLVEDAKTGARLGVPEKLTPHVSAARSGTRWSSAQGQIQIETFQFAEAALPALFDEEKKTARRQTTSSSLKPDSFIIMGVQGLKNFVVRADARGSAVRGITVLYDQATEGTMSRVAINVANAFVGFPDPNAAPPAGLAAPGRVRLGDRCRQRRRVDRGVAYRRRLPGDHGAAARPCRADRRGQGQRPCADPPLWRAQSRAGAARRRRCKAAMSP